MSGLFWLRYFPLGVALAGLPFAYVVVLLSAGLVRPAKEAVAPGLPWYERARNLHPALQTSRGGQLLVPLFCMAYGLLMHGPVSATPVWLAVGVGLPLAMFGAVLGHRALLAPYGLALPFGEYLRSVALFLLVQLSFLWVPLLGTLALGTPRSPAAHAGFAAFLVATLAACAGGGAFVARALGLARPARPMLVEAAARAAAAQGRAPRFLWELDFAQANAFAFPWLQAVGVTPRLLDVVTVDELAAVLGHELGHLKETWPMRLARLVLPLSLGLCLLFIDPLLRLLSLLGFLGALLSLLLFSVLIRRYLLKLEHRADAGLGGDDPAYARALEKIYAANLVPAVIGLKIKTHPELYDRMVAAGHPPSWPRPEPPLKRKRGIRLMGVLIALPLIPWFFTSLDGANLREPTAWTVAVSGRTQVPMFLLANTWMVEGRAADARTLLLALNDDQPPWVILGAVKILFDAGYCADAKDLAQRRGLLEPGSGWKPRLEARAAECQEGIASQTVEPP